MCPKWWLGVDVLSAVNCGGDIGGLMEFGPVRLKKKRGRLQQLKLLFYHPLLSKHR